MENKQQKLLGATSKTLSIGLIIGGAMAVSPKTVQAIDYDSCTPIGDSTYFECQGDVVHCGNNVDTDVCTDEQSGETYE